MNNQTVKVIALIAVIFVASAFTAYFIFNSPATAPATPSSTVAVPSSTATNMQGQTEPAPARDSESFISQVFGEGDTDREQVGSEGWAVVFLRVTIRLTLAALLTALLAFRPRRFALVFKRNLFVAQTQILLAVVGSALMMIVGDSAARAFGIFAAVSLVRFRTNIRDPKEITVLLVSLAVGLATGVGRWELALILCLFVLGLLWVLEYRESEKVFRTLELKIRTRNLLETDEIARGIFKKYEFSSELRALNREDGEDPVGCIVFSVDVSPLVSTDDLSAEILAADNNNIDSIEWTQQKNVSSLYN
jgi:hypothetical protein